MARTESWVRRSLWPAALVAALAAGAWLGAGGPFGGGVDTEPASDQGIPEVPPPPVYSAPRPFSASLTGANAVSRAMGAGLGCDGQEPVDEVHLFLEAALPAGLLSQLAGTVRANLAVATSVAIDSKIIHRLEPAATHLTLGNDRGTLRLQLEGGGCPTRNLTGPTGGPVAGNGALAVIGGTGAYRDAAFTDGTWALSTEIGPGADNQWTLAVMGEVAVLAPGLEVELVGTHWGNEGYDYLTRTVTATYRITNSGSGDAYAAALVSTSSVAGVTAVGPTPQPLGDLLAGESVEVSVRYRLALLGPPCTAGLLGCEFPTTLTVTLPDALDQPATHTATVTVAAPTLPPPMEGL